MPPRAVGSGSQTGRLTLRLDESWRDALSPRLQRTIRLVAGPLMRHYGYR